MGPHLAWVYTSIQQVPLTLGWVLGYIPTTKTWYLFPNLNPLP